MVWQLLKVPRETLVVPDAMGLPEAGSRGKGGGVTFKRRKCGVGEWGTRIRNGSKPLVWVQKGQKRT